MGCTFLVTILQWAYIPMMVTALNCYQCETEDTFQSCVTNSTNLIKCDAGDVCYNMSGTWEGEAVAFRGCAAEYISLGCKKVFEHCTMFWSDELCEIPCIAWKDCTAANASIWRESRTQSYQNLTTVRMNVTDISMCYCKTDGCNADGHIADGTTTTTTATDGSNGSFKLDRPGLYIIFALASFSSSLAIIVCT